jgi:hypothetical protein
MTLENVLGGIPISTTDICLFILSLSSDMVLEIPTSCVALRNSKTAGINQMMGDVYVKILQTNIGASGICG